jgi:hypothetical protein
VITADVHQMKAVAKMIRESGDKELRKAFTKGTNEAVEPAKDAVRSSARSELPHRGGLAERVASSKFRVQRLTGKAPGIVLIMRLAKEHGGGSVDLKRMNSGSLRHPVYGHRGRWVLQSVRSEWFTRALDDVRPRVTRGVSAAVADVAAQLAARSRSIG